MVGQDLECVRCGNDAVELALPMQGQFEHQHQWMPGVIVQINAKDIQNAD